MVWMQKLSTVCPQLGFSTRYDDRKGLGRFGVGATYASISQCKRTIFCSRPKGTSNFIATYIDLDEIGNKTQADIPKPSKSYLPEDLEQIDVDNSSTIVVWNKCDRLKSNANGNPIRSEDLLKELKKWISRAYRYIIWGGVEIYINSEKILAHDPLYLNTSQTKFPNDPSSTVKCTKSIKWDVPGSKGKTSTISVTLTLLPEVWRKIQGDGGREHAVERRIPENQGLSILRHHREVAYRNLYPTVPSQIAIDRWWGCEMNFEPELDECWKVRNIKRGASPIKELSDELQKRLVPKILELRKEVQNYWKTKIPADIFQHIRQTALSLMEKNSSVTATDVQGQLSGQKISIDDISRVLEDLAIEKEWDWTTDGTDREYIPSPQLQSKLESEGKMCFENIKRTIKNSDIDEKFKDVALYDLEQAKVSYEWRAFKACIVMFGAVIEGLMLGVIRKDTTLIAMITNPKTAPKVVQNLGLNPSSKPEEIADKISDKLNFEDYKTIIFHLKPEIEKLKIERIQNLRNTIHPWKAIKEPRTFRDPGPTIAINYLSSLSLLAEQILA